MLYNAHISLGEHIRQLRRQHHMTQSELGAEHFSKSYISAVERDKIHPSTEALLFFTSQLHQSPGYFQKWQSEASQELSLVSNASNEASKTQQEILILLDTLLENTETASFSLTEEELPHLSLQTVEVLSVNKRARYYFLRGLVTQEKRELEDARRNFEIALAFAPEPQQPAILDELGENYYQLKSYQVALEYHLRARRLLWQQASSLVNPILQFRVELHCGCTYHALGDYQRACKHYELARQRLQPKQDVQTAGKLYLGLGYCTYMLIKLRIAGDITGYPSSTTEESEQAFQNAIGFLLQSRILYQVGRESQGEALARLTLTHVLLDLCKQREHAALKRAEETGMKAVLNISSLLEDAEEQCRQTIMLWQEYFETNRQPSSSIISNIYIALAQLVRTFTLRAVSGRINMYASTAQKELLQATSLCEQILDSLKSPTLPYALLQKAIHTQTGSSIPTSLSLPRSSALMDQRHQAAEHMESYVEISLAAAGVAEEIGRTARNKEYALLCFKRAEEYLLVALESAQRTSLEIHHNHNYMIYTYQRCIALLDERCQQVEAFQHDTTTSLLQILRQGFFNIQRIPIPDPGSEI